MFVPKQQGYAARIVQPGVPVELAALLFAARRQVLPLPLLLVLLVLLLAPLASVAQLAPDARSSGNTKTVPNYNQQQPGNAVSSDLPQQDLYSWGGLRVVSVTFQGVSADALAPLPAQLPLQAGQALDPQKVRDSLRRLYATGLYQTIQVAGVRAGDDVSIIFSGAPRLFLGHVKVNGVNNDQLTAVLESATKLQPGSPYSPNKVGQADDRIKESLQENGFYKGTIARTTVIDQPNALIDLNYAVSTGKAARVGDVAIAGDPGVDEKKFRKKARLKRNSKVTRNTVTRALTGLRKNYQKTNHLGAKVSLTSQQYQPPKNQINYDFLANQGAIITVEVQGAKLKRSLIERLVPIYEEGAVDQDLLNEGSQNLRSYFQSKGYFDVQVSHQPVRKDPKHVIALYTVDLNAKHIVDSVKVTGNKYFSTQIVEQHIAVRKSNIVERQGVFSQQLVNQDVASISALYQSNGFGHVKVTPVISDTDTQNTGNKQLAHLALTYTIDEGVQQRIGKYQINGTSKVPLSALQPLLNTQAGQPYSSINLNGDRDQIATYYLSHGFENAQINLVQQPEPGNPDLINVNMNITEGDQVFVNKVLVSGLHYTRRSVIDSRMRLHPGDPLNETALLEMQRNLYDLSLFNEVNTAIQNPNGSEERKNVLLQLTEAKRWDINYGFGFEVQTGTPQRNCPSPATLIQLGLNPNTFSCAPNGKFGASPRVLFDISRINLRGTDQSIHLRSNYGTLEQSVTLTYTDPHVFHSPHFDLNISGGYNNSQNVTTYASSATFAAAKISHRLDKANNLLYSFNYRRVQVSNVQVSFAEIPLLSQPVRVGGPSVSWIRDTRDVALDAHHGTYTTAEEFLSGSKFGSQANFDRLDITNASYYDFGRRHWVLARLDRYGQERAFGNGAAELIPLPERLYAGGATSHRGFGINAAGPRDPQTGYPVGGAGAFINTVELRTPAPNLPYVGGNVSFVIFHDMGNVFAHASDIWPSFFRISQPHSQTCQNLHLPSNIDPDSPQACSFNYFSHAIGLGFRYHTPIGPIRVDFSDNLNPPSYPVVYDYNNSNAPPHVGQAQRFNFFFSIGQSF